MKNSPEMARASLLPFFNNTADDLAQVVDNLNRGRFSHVKGTITRGATSLDYIHMVTLPVLTSLFDHLGRSQCGADVIGMYTSHSCAQPYQQFRVKAFAPLLTLGHVKNILWFSDTDALSKFSPPGRFYYQLIQKIAAVQNKI